MAISKKKKWVNDSGWRGHYEFVNEVAGANDTGGWDDSPCPTKIRVAEIGMAKTRLRKAKIPHITAWCQSSNVFMASQRVLVAPEDRARAIEALQGLREETMLLWIEQV